MSQLNFSLIIISSAQEVSIIIYKDYREWAAGACMCVLYIWDWNCYTWHLYRGLAYLRVGGHTYRGWLCGDDPNLDNDCFAVISAYTLYNHNNFPPLVEIWLNLSCNAVTGWMIVIVLPVSQRARTILLTSQFFSFGWLWCNLKTCLGSACMVSCSQITESYHIYSNLWCNTMTWCLV